MLMILLHHFVVHNAFDVSRMPVSLPKFIFYMLFASGGKIAVVIFFSISAWFLLDGDWSIRACWKRVWLLERELIFWSVTLLVFTFCLNINDFGIKLILRSFLPISSGLWWYATSYALFLLFMPFLTAGLRALKRNVHLLLCCTLILIYGILGLVPGIHYSFGDISVAGVFGFIYLYILICAHKWYLPDLFINNPVFLIIIGAVPILINTVVCVIVPSFGVNGQIYFADNWRLPVILVGYGLFHLFNGLLFRSKLIDNLAKSAFAVYLITDYPAMRSLLWTKLFSIDKVYARPIDLITILLLLLGIYTVCTLLDLARQKLFSISVNRNNERLFNSIFDYMLRRFEV